MMYLRFMAALAAGMLAGAGCRKAADGSAATGATNAPAEKPIAVQAIEGFTGKTAVDAGQRAKATLKGVQQQRQEDFDALKE